MASFMWMLLTEPSYKRTLLGVRLASEESKPEDITEAITSWPRSKADKTPGQGPQSYVGVGILF